jgi:hypothetical protein
MICDQTITVVRAGHTTDRYHNTSADWDTAGRTTVMGVSVQPESQQETSEPGRRPATTGYRVISDSGVDIDVTAGRVRRPDLRGQWGRRPLAGPDRRRCRSRRVLDAAGEGVAVAKFRVVVNRAGLRQVLRAPGVQADLRQRAERIAAAADAAANDPGGHRVVAELGANRARAAVVTATPKSMYKEATVRSLTRSIDAGR